MTTTLVLVRHGRTAWNKEERFRGRTELPLDETGLQQAVLVAGRISQEYHPAAVFSSPLQRALSTAQAVSRQIAVEVKPHNDLVDIDYGDFAGLSLPEAEVRFPALYRTWLSSPHTVQFPNGESLEVVRTRAMNLVASVLEHYHDQQVVLVSHVVVCRLLLCSLLGVGNDYFWRFRIDPASVNVFTCSREQTVLQTANDICHLKAVI